jgi:hypothetical protein
MNKTEITVIKANGQAEAFNPSKLENSLLRAKATKEIAKEVIQHVQNELHDGITTAQIYKHAFFVLNKLRTPAAHMYSIRQALAELGPSGFPFEKYIAEIFKSLGYTTETNQIVMGGCVGHEVDVVAWNDAKLIMCEAKFHNDLSMKTDLKVALYVKSRFDDLVEATHNYGGKRRKLDEGWLITNTKFTSTAIQYSLCKGLKLIGWNYPEKGNLQDLIEDGDLMPITTLNEIHKGETKILLESGIVLCKQIRENVSLLVDAGIQRDRAEIIVAEVNSIQNK